MASNFEFLAKYWPDMAQIGKTAELYLYADANSCIYKTGLLAERVAQEICVFEKLDLPEHTTHADRIRALKYADLEKKADDIHSSYERTGKELKKAEVRLREVQPLIKNISNYQRLKPVYDAFQQAKDKPSL